MRKDKKQAQGKAFLCGNSRQGHPDLEMNSSVVGTERGLGAGAGGRQGCGEGDGEGVPAQRADLGVGF